MSWVRIVRGYGLWRIITEDLGGWGRSVQKWYQSCWMKDKRSGVCKCFKTFWSNLKLNPTCWKELLLAMSHGSFKYDPLTKWQRLEWKNVLSPIPKKVRVFKSKTKVMQIAFFDVHEPTQNSCHKAKLLISTSTKTSCNVWCAQWGRKEENCRKRGYGCFITTMLQIIRPWEFGSFLPKITLLYWSNHPTLRIWPLVTSFCSPNSRVIKGTRFQEPEAIKTVTTRELRAIPKESF